MGRLIDDETYAPKPMSNEEIVESLKTMVFGVQAFERFNVKERETLSRAWNLIDQYEAKLKADMIAILTDIQLEIEESCICTYEVNKLIQQKINELKTESEG